MSIVFRSFYIGKLEIYKITRTIRESKEIFPEWYLHHESLSEEHIFGRNKWICIIDAGIRKSSRSVIYLSVHIGTGEKISTTYIQRKIKQQRLVSILWFQSLFYRDAIIGGIQKRSRFWHNQKYCFTLDSIRRCGLMLYTHLSTSCDLRSFEGSNIGFYFFIIWTI